VGPYPPGFQLHPNVPPEIHAQALRRGMEAPTLATPTSASHASATTTIGPQITSPQVEDVPKTDPVISAAPQMRNLAGESTRFVPTALRAPRTQPVKPKAPRAVQQGIKKAASNNPHANTSVDEACDLFLKEIQDLL